jgi:hypothetical protein
MNPILYSFKTYVFLELTYDLLKVLLLNVKLKTSQKLGQDYFGYLKRKEKKKNHGNSKNHTNFSISH